MEYYIKHIVLSLIALLSVTGSPFAQEKAYVFLEKNVRLDTAIMISSNNIVYSPDVVSCSWNDCVYISDMIIRN